MIYTRFGSEVTVAAYCGKHKPKWASSELVLVQVKHQDDGTCRYAHAIHLKADGGWKEIDAAVDAAPAAKLKPAEIKKALAEAE